MTTRCAFFFVAGLAVLAAADDRSADRKLIVQASRGGGSVTVAATSSDGVTQPVGKMEKLEAQARAELSVSQARLELVLARKALTARRYAKAADHARRALAVFANVSNQVDVSVLELQAEGVIAKARRLGGEPVLLGEMRQPDANTQRDMQDTAPDYPLARRSRAAATVARQFDGADTDVVDTRGNAEVLMDRAVRNQEPTSYGYRPGREIIDRRAVIDRDNQRIYYQDALREAYRANEARLLTEVDEARITPSNGLVSYPDNWPEIVRKRAKYKDGVVARSPSWTDKDGREWYVAIYDIHDLIYEPPDFQNIEGLGFLPREGLQAAEDRAALRQYSEIFRGFPEDLAAGIPLLRHFGGLGDPFAYRGPKYSLERQQQIINMIRAFTGEKPTEPSVQPVVTP